jgi:sugar/nucleoside kinase (ribokinase family)
MNKTTLQVVGSVVLDTLRNCAYPHDREVGLGGVCLNAAVAARQEFDRVRFVTSAYRGNINELIEHYLADRGITWWSLSPVVPVPLFEAMFGAEEYVQQRFDCGRAYEVLDAQLVIGDAGPDDGVLTCTSLSAAQLDVLLSAFAISFLLVSSPSTAPIVTALGKQPDFLGLNRVELEEIAGRQLPLANDIARAATALVGPTGFALVTLNSDGALLGSRSGQCYLHMPATRRAPRRGHWVGAGDLLFGTFAGAVLRGLDLDIALARGIVSSACALGQDISAMGNGAVDEVLVGSSGWVAFA